VPGVRCSHSDASKADAADAVAQPSYIQLNDRSATAWTCPGERGQNLPLPLELSDDELQTAAQACRAMAYEGRKRAESMENPACRGPIEAASRRYAALAEKLEAARKRAS
jgi:hypothetical protein